MNIECSAPKPGWLAGILTIGLTLWTPVSGQAQTAQQWAAARQRMVNDEIVGGGITRQGVITSMRGTPRHEFVPSDQRRFAYYDMALPIGEQQTITTPFAVAYMTEKLDPQPEDRVLEIGTGSGYQAAVLAGLVRRVYTIEIHEPLAQRAAETLRRLGYSNVVTKVGDGFQGWPEYAPFDKIMVTCSPEQVPQPLVDQLREGGLMLIPLGERFQQVLYRMRKINGKLVSEPLEPTFFVPMTGRADLVRAVRDESAITTLHNGDFEHVGSTGQPEPWYYLRHATREPHPTKEGGRYCLAFKNTTPGCNAQALQAIGVDGRRIPELNVELSIRGANIVKGQFPEQLPKVLITYFDENLTPISQASVGPWTDSFGWSFKSGQVPVPSNSRLAIVGIGLLGATGEFYCDDVRVTASERALTAATPTR